MKRSEMVVKICDFLREPGEEQHIKQFASNLLTRLENLGMQPPWSDPVFQRRAKVYQESDGFGWDEE